jgi:hypothetical protein
MKIYVKFFILERADGGGRGQLISKCPFGVFKSPKKPTKFFVRISALASKKRSNQKSSLRESQ